MKGFTTMERRRALVVGAGRIGSGWGWHDLSYTHAGAIQANKDRVQLVGFVEPDADRAAAAKRIWEVPVYENCIIGMEVLKPDIVCIATQPEKQVEIISNTPQAKAYYCEKPYWAGKTSIPTQINFIRRADPRHQDIANRWWPSMSLFVRGKLDHHTLPHFEDLTRWWKAARLVYEPYNGPCSYHVDLGSSVQYFENGGVDGGTCMKAMLANLLDHLDTGTPLWSPAT
jgi:hypothetical protein